MNRSPITPAELAGVIAVPPLCRQPQAARAPDFVGTARLLRHLADGGITRFMFGGNAQLFHITLRDYDALLGFLADQPDDWWMLPACGPAYGRALDQAALLKRHRFPALMLLPCSDPRDAAGMETGLREIHDAAETKLILYLKDETNFGTNRDAGLAALGHLVADGVCVGIKYAIVRDDPATDPYLEALLRHVPRERVVSGMGERPAVVHLRDWRLPGFTTGSGCLAPRLTVQLHAACQRGDWETAERVRQRFLALEDLRDAWNPARVLHHAVALAGIADTGPMSPFLSPLADGQLEQLRPVARALFHADGDGAAPT